MAQLWNQKKRMGNKDTHRFTVADDYILDNVLLPHDIIGTIAHVKGLRRIGVLRAHEARVLCNELARMRVEAIDGSLTVKKDDEDCHSLIERTLTVRLGDVGKKVHTGRSRNDQVLTALRLYMRAEMDLCLAESRALESMFRTKARQYRTVQMPGYTHMQRAMPSSVYLWLSSFADACADGHRLIAVAQTILDQSPLGSVVGYGEQGLGLARPYTAEVLGFSRVQKNPIYTAQSRGVFELIALQSLTITMASVARFATDMMLFTTKEFAFFSLPKSLTTGSSAMPHKVNYDVLELIRARTSLFYAECDALSRVIDKLPSGYNRDFQLTKGIVMRAFASIHETLRTCRAVVSGLRAHPDILARGMTAELYATEEAYQLVKKNGVPFRDAYHEVAQKYRSR